MYSMLSCLYLYTLYIQARKQDRGRRISITRSELYIHCNNPTQIDCDKRFFHLKVGMLNEFCKNQDIGRGSNFHSLSTSIAA
jgi:hypothetical protein